MIQRSQKYYNKTSNFWIRGLFCEVRTMYCRISKLYQTIQKLEATISNETQLNNNRLSSQVCVENSFFKRLIAMLAEDLVWAKSCTACS